MHRFGQDAELPFFEANEEMDSKNPIDGNFLFDVWNESPRSVVERRRKFLEWMGVDDNQVQAENSDSASNAESDFDRVREDNSEAVLRTAGCNREFSSSSQLSSLSILSGSSEDLSREMSFIVDGNARGIDGTRTDSQLTRDGELYKSSMASCCRSRCCKLKENEKQRKIVGRVNSFKKEWLSRLRSFGCAVDTKVESDSTKASVFVDLGFGHRISRVKVKHCKKQFKEFSALYKGQEIKAHDGSILTMKFSFDGKYLASAGEDGVVRVWKVMEDKRSRQRDCPEIDPSCMYFEVNELSELKPIVVDQEKTKTLKGMKKRSDSACVVFPPKVFRIQEKPLNEFRGHTAEILDISWSRNNYLLSASMDKTARLWRIGSKNCHGVFPHSGYVTSLQFNPENEDYFISGSIDGKVRIWDISGCKVVDWVDVREIISAVCYRPDGQGGIIGSLTGSCRFFNVSGNYLELEGRIHLHNKKKSSNKRITGFQFFPEDLNKIMVVSADSQVRILDGDNVVRRYSSHYKTGSLTSASFTSDGKHIISACEDSNVYIWNCNNDEEPDSSQLKKVQSFERFSNNASIAIPWCGFSINNASTQNLPFSSPSYLSLGEGLVLGSSVKGCATWPEENLPASPLSTSALRASQYKFLKASFQGTTSSHAWGMVIVTAGWDGRIRAFQNYGLPLVT